MSETGASDSSSPTMGGPTSSSARRGRGSGGGPVARLTLFLRQVVAELKKVVRPTRNELVTYTSVVLVFVLTVMLIVSGFDYAFGQLVLWAFGG